MWVLKAPSPVFEVFVGLPEPEFRDIERQTSTVQTQRAMDGSIRTHVKRSSNRTYQFTFNLTRLKALELDYVYRLYCSALWEIERTDGSKLIGYFKTNPLTFDITQRGVYCGSNDVVVVNLEFESVA